MPYRHTTDPIHFPSYGLQDHRLVARDGLGMEGPATVNPVPVPHVLLSGCHACQGEYGSCPARIPYLHPLLPSYAHDDYRPPGVYQCKTRTIGGATLHHASMSHQKYMTRASMMIYRIRAHEQWLHICMTVAERLYRATFSGTSRSIRASYVEPIHSRHRAAYESAGALKRQIHP